MFSVPFAAAYSFVHLIWTVRIMLLFLKLFTLEGEQKGDVGPMTGTVLKLIWFVLSSYSDNPLTFSVPQFSAFKTEIILIPFFIHQ